VQALDFRDDRCLCVFPLWSVDRQAGSHLLIMPQLHLDVEPFQ
jgi:hypothetical protein